MLRVKVIFGVLFWFSLQPGGLSGEGLGGNEKAADADSSQTYVIQPNDVLEVFVWKEPELSRKVLVRPDGCISFPLVQDLTAAGRTPPQLKEGIEEKLREYITTANVTVIVDAIQYYKIYVTGKVQSPGSFTSEKPVSVLQALTMAGGFQEFADASNIRIVRNQARNHHVLRFNYGDVINGKSPGQDIMLRPGDVVVVP